MLGYLFEVENLGRVPGSGDVRCFFLFTVELSWSSGEIDLFFWFDA